MEVHDELNYIIPNAKLEVVQKVALEEVGNTIKLQVPLIADCRVGANWLEAHWKELGILEVWSYAVIEYENTAFKVVYIEKLSL